MSKQGVPVAGPIYGRELEESFDWMSMILYGDFGVGKTWLAGSSVFEEDMRDILYVSLEGGEKGLVEIARQCRARNIDPSKHILVIPVQNYKQYAYIYEFIKIHIKLRDSDDLDGLRKLEAQIRGKVKDTVITVEMLNDKAKLAELIPEPKKFRTVVTDSLSEAQKYCMYQILGIEPTNQKLDVEPDSAQFQDWGSSREMIQFLVRRYRDIPMHSIFICGRNIDQDAFKKFHYSPMLPGKLSNDVRGLVDIVGYLEKIPQENGQVIRRLYLEGGYYGATYIAAKHRFGSKLKGLWVDNATMETIYELDQQ